MGIQILSFFYLFILLYYKFSFFAPFFNRVENKDPNFQFQEELLVMEAGEYGDSLPSSELFYRGASRKCQTNDATGRPVHAP